MANSRTEVPAVISAKIVFEQDQTCCICRVRGPVTQIHHIDGDPTNHHFENLAVLCLEDHNRTQLRGGFGRHLSAAVVVEYRNDWVTRVRERRNRADTTAHIAQTTVIETPQTTEAWSPPSTVTIIGYVNALPLVRRAAHAAARPRWDTGIGFEMREATYEVIDVFQQVLSRLTSFYPPGYFGLPPAEYFSAYIDSRYHWYVAIFQPAGHNTGGTLVNEITAGMVMKDVAALIEQMVEGLFYGGMLEDFDPENWRRDWEAASE